jgi:YtcA family
MVGGEAQGFNRARRFGGNAPLLTAGAKLVRPCVATMSPQTNRVSTEHRQSDKDALAFEAKWAPRARRAALPVFITSTALGGCASRGAPSFVLFGAFFPAWMLCALIGIFGAIAARGIFVAVGLDSVLPFQLFVCSSVGLVVATLSWLIWFGQ